MVGPK